MQAWADRLLRRASHRSNVPGNKARLQRGSGEKPIDGTSEAESSSETGFTGSRDGLKKQCLCRIKSLQLHSRITRVLDDEFSGKTDMNHVFLLTIMFLRQKIPYELNIWIIECRLTGLGLRKCVRILSIDLEL